MGFRRSWRNQSVLDQSFGIPTGSLRVSNRGALNIAEPHAVPLQLGTAYATSRMQPPIIFPRAFATGLQLFAGTLYARPQADRGSRQFGRNAHNQRAGGVT